MSTGVAIVLAFVFVVAVIACEDFVSTYSRARRLEEPPPKPLDFRARSDIRRRSSSRPNGSNSRGMTAPMWVFAIVVGVLCAANQLTIALVVAVLAAVVSGIGSLLSRRGNGPGAAAGPAQTLPDEATLTRMLRQRKQRRIQPPLEPDTPEDDTTMRLPE